MKDSSQDPTTHSQEWQQDDNPIRGARKLAQSGECESSGSTGKSVRGIDNKFERTRLEYHNMQISEYRYVERVFKNVRPKLNRSQNVQMLELKTYVLIWGLFVSTTMKASVHLGPDYNENLTGHRNTNFEELKTLFDITQRSILETQIRDSECFTIELTFSPWMRSTLPNDTVIKWAKAKVHVYSYSVLCWKDVRMYRSECKNRKHQFPDFHQSNSYRELFGIDGEEIEFEWNIFPGLCNIGDPSKDAQNFRRSTNKSRTL